VREHYPHQDAAKTSSFFLQERLAKKKWINQLQEHKNLFRKKKILASNGRIRFKNEIISVG
jgi:hypothetical protein